MWLALITALAVFPFWAQRLTAQDRQAKSTPSTESETLPTTLPLASSVGRFDEAKRTAITLIQSAKFARASALLEEVWEQEKTDSLVAENLAIAYLNGDARRKDPRLADAAVELMESAIGLGGKATFIVRLSTESFVWLQGRGYNDYCSGRLVFRPQRLIFIADPCHQRKPQSFDVSASAVKKFEFLDKDSHGSVRVRVRDRNYEFAPYSEKREDGALITEFAKKYITTNR